MVTRILLVLLVMTGVATAQPAKLTIGVYAPSVQFDTAQARLAYAQGLAKAIEQATAIPTTADVYATLAALKKAAPDYAIIDGLCYATNLNYKLLANAKVGEGTTRTYALWSNAGETMQSLKGKKLAYVSTGCNDNGFIDNAMLESEVDAKFFGARQPEKDLTGAVASVQSYKTAQAVFAPASSVKGLTKVFDTGPVPNPAFVEVNNTLPNNVTDKVGAAVVGYGGSGAISGWARPSRDAYANLGSRLAPVRKQGVFAQAEGVKLNSNEVMLEPSTLKEPQYVAVRHHFQRPPGGRLD
jgi:hypothetical protein